jgi:hypothetical protein
MPQKRHSARWIYDANRNHYLQACGTGFRLGSMDFPLLGGNLQAAETGLPGPTLPQKRRIHERIVRII